MNILMLTPDHQMIDRRILLEAMSLTEAGHHVTLIAGFECAKEETYDYHGITIHRLCYDWNDTRLTNLQRRLPKNPRVRNFINKVIKKLINTFSEVPSFEHFVFRKATLHKADVVHAHDYPALRAAVIIAKRRGIPLVYDAHELYYAQKVLPVKTQRKIFRTERKLIKNATLVITTNDFAADLIGKRSGIARPHVLYSATTLPATLPSRDASPLRKLFPENSVILLYQGWISGERNIETLVRAMPFLPPQACLAIIGYGAYEATLKEIAAELKLGDRVHFFGRIENEGLMEFTRGADIGLIPYLPIDENHLYSSPNKFFEFVVSGIPMLSHTSPFFLKMKKEFGMIECADLNSPEKTAAGIVSMLEPKRLAELRERCAEAAKTLNWQVESKKLLAIYDKLGASIGHPAKPEHPKEKVAL